MARKLTLSLLANPDLSMANVTTTSQRIEDWTDTLYPEDGSEGAEIVLPPVTFGAVYERAEDLLTKSQQRTADRFPDREVPPDLAERFEGSDGHDEWRASFDPMMNYVWPVALPYRADASQVAALLNEFCPVMTLVNFGDDSPFCSESHAFALSGGGMNLADQIATAYLCAGVVPPSSLLESLPGVISDYQRDKVAPVLRKAYRKAADYHAYRAKAIRREAGRVFTKS